MKGFKKLPKDKQQKIMLVAIGSLIVTVLAIQYYVAGQFSTITKSKDKISNLEQQISAAESKAKLEAQNKPLREQTQTFVDAQYSAMVSGDPFSWVMREITLLSEKHPVRVASLRPGTISKHSRIARFDVYTTRIDLTSNYDQLGNFLRDLENRFPASEIRSLEIMGTGTARAELSVALELALLMRPQKESEQPAADKAKDAGKKAS